MAKFFAVVMILGAMIDFGNTELTSDWPATVWFIAVLCAAVVLWIYG